MELKGHKSLVCSVSFSSDGQKLATVETDKSIKIWDVATWKEMLGPTVPKLVGSRFLAPVAFSPNGHFLAVGGLGSLEVWEVNSWKLATKISVPNADGVTFSSLVFSSDSSVLAFGSSAHGCVELWGWDRPNSFAETVAATIGPDFFTKQRKGRREAEEQQAAFMKERAEILERVKKEKNYLPPVKVLENSQTFNDVTALLGQPTERQRNLMQQNAEAVLAIWTRGDNGFIAIYFVNGVRGGILGYGVDRNEIDRLCRIMKGQVR